MRLSGALAFLAAACAALPPDPAERALYVDIRKTVQLSEDEGWVVDAAQRRADAEPVSRSVCQVAPAVRAELAAWLARRIALTGSAAEAFRRNGADLDAVSETLSLERTLMLLEDASTRAPTDCPFWLSPRNDFSGVQTDAGRWVLLAETLGFASYVVNTHVPSLSGGARLLIGHGLGPELTWALGGEVTAGGAFIPRRSGLGGTLTLATPALLRLTRFSRLMDVEFAPVIRYTGQARPWPPGARVQLGAGLSSLRSSALMPYFMLYAGYEFHPRALNAPADHTLIVGTRLAVDWGL
jgi:hypothetical protein